MDRTDWPSVGDITAEMASDWLCGGADLVTGAGLAAAAAGRGKRRSCSGGGGVRRKGFILGACDKSSRKTRLAKLSGGRSAPCATTEQRSESLLRQPRKAIFSPGGSGFGPCWISSADEQIFKCVKVLIFARRSNCMRIDSA
jgi:hypothetical protein